MRDIVVNAVLFQCLWFLAILVGADWALLAMIPLALHAIVTVGGIKRLAPFAVVVLWGVTVDSLLCTTGIYQPAEARAMLLGVVPVWLAMMWIGFALTVPLSLSSLVRKRVLFIALSGIAGPLSYLGGERLGALSIVHAFLPLLSLVWVISGSISVWAYQAFKRSEQPRCLGNGSIFLAQERSL